MPRARGARPQRGERAADPTETTIGTWRRPLPTRAWKTCRRVRPARSTPVGPARQKRNRHRRRVRLARDLAIDLGTANTLVYSRGRGIVLNEPTVIALNSRTQDVLAMGQEAWQMIGRTPGYIVAVRPLRKGAITLTSTSLSA